MFSDDTEPNKKIPESITTNTVVFSLGDLARKKYQSRHNTEMSINGSLITDFFHEQEFDLELIARGTIYHMLLSVNKSNYEDGLGLKEKLGGILKKVTDLKNVLEFDLNPSGKIKDVTNKVFLKEKWETLKASLLLEAEIQALPADILRKMMAKGDEEYMPSYPLHKELEKSLFHSSLFRGFYNQPFVLGDRYPVANVLIMSTFFEELSIPMRVHLEVAYDEQYDEYILKYEGNVDKLNFDTQKAKSLYNKQYPFLQEKFERYTFDFQALYVLNKQDNWLKFARITVNEKINQSIESVINLEMEEVYNG
ncbi:hypothetical protein H7F33_10170 [Pedobacter sp. PAMC26386]|nr:hypothetical protein H7F33_10170 [Pedobacter sp. PAMC26386]